MKKTYKWIIMFVFVVAACIVGGYFKNKSEIRLNLDEFKPVDIENTNIEETANMMEENSSDYPLHININTATAEELDLIPGVGPSTAKQIVDYRNSAGPFNNLQELKLIDNIGDKTIEKISKYAILE